MLYNGADAQKRLPIFAGVSAKKRLITRSLGSPVGAQDTFKVNRSAVSGSP